MRKILNKKKKGFTLIELIAVIAIIGILATVLVPKVVGYMKDAKNSKVVAEARNVLMAFETVNAKGSLNLDASKTSVDNMKSYTGEKWKEYFDLSNVNSLKGWVFMTDLKELTDNPDNKQALDKVKATN